MRRLLFVASGLVALAAFQLFVLTEHTDRYFSWTIAPNATAVFLGAGYLASIVLENLGARRAAWADARHTIPPVLSFTILTEVATILHIGKFHFHKQLIWAGAAAWLWLAIYTLVPIAFLLLLPRQLRVRGEDPPRRAPLPRAAVTVLALQAAVMAVLGVILFLDPVRWASIWPWRLTPLTGRATAAWLLGVAIGVIAVLFERDLERIRHSTLAYALFGTFQLVAIARYPHDIGWGQPQSAIYLAVVASIAVIGWIGVYAARGSPKARIGALP
jgi:hypothetical protein